MRKSVFFLFTVIFFLTLFACQSESQGNQSETKGDDQQATLSTEEVSSLLEIHCNGCHDPQAPSHDALKAPPLVATKYYYKQEFPERGAFITKMTDFLENPTREDAVMPEAIDRFGAKFKTSLSREQLEAISAYIYDQQLEAPSWFAEHFEEEHGIEWQQ